MQLDPELFWIISEALAGFKLNHANFNNGYYKPRDLFTVVINNVAKVIFERFKVNPATLGYIDLRQTLELVYQAYKNLNKNCDSMSSLVNEFLIYIINDIILQVRYSFLFQ